LALAHPVRVNPYRKGDAIMAKRALSSQFVTVCVSLIFSLSTQATTLTVDYQPGPPPKAFEPTAIRETIGHKVDWRRFNNDPEMVSPAQQTTARRDDGTATAIGERTKFLLEQGKVETVLPDYAPYVSAKYVTE
jgi:ABC-type taurine transport system substrate-binding protein